MELIAKVTSRCDMSCTFCSASNIRANDMTPKEVADAANRIGATSIILLGGAALCMGIEFYLKLLSLTKATLDFTTNLKDFSMNPEIWTPLFKEERVSVCTSFNFGTTRMLDPHTVYTVDKFKATMKLFNEKIGYMPQFIAVIDKENAHTWRKHIELAKELGTRCRLNNALKLGRQGETFPRAEMFKIWTTIAREGLDQYELNTYERATGRCPINSCQLCETTIRVVQKCNGKIVFYNCDDRSNAKNTPLSESQIETAPRKSSPTPMFMKCYSCELFNVCNGCKTNVERITDPEQYCETMESIKEDIISLGWKL